MAAEYSTCEAVARSDRRLKALFVCCVVGVSLRFNSEPAVHARFGAPRSTPSMNMAVAERALTTTFESASEQQPRMCSVAG